MLKTVMHIGKSPCAGAPGNLNTCLNKYSYYNSKIYCEKPIIAISNFMCDYQDNLTKSDLQHEINEADIIHFHNCSIDQFNKYDFINKPFIIQLHSEPKNKAYILRKYRSICMTIAQKHTTLYKSPIYTVPNLFDIYEERYLPAEKSKDKVVIFYSATSVCNHSDYSFTCAGKGYTETSKILNSIKKQYAKKVEIITFLKENKDIVLAAKRKADIVIDECVTGGYHLTSLESLSMGCITINALNNKVEKVFRDICNFHKGNIPFDRININDLFNHLCYLIDSKINNPKDFRNWQDYNRTFMENYWHPSTMVNYYEKKYDEMIGQSNNPYNGLRYSSNINLVRQDRNVAKSRYQDVNIINLEDLKDAHKNKPALILGMGQSVNKVNLDVHFNNGVIFACNYFQKKFPNLIPNYWCCIDSGAFRENIDNIDNQSVIIANYPAKHKKFDNENGILWLTDNIDEYNKEFNSCIEIERPFTVATIMLMNAIYYGCDPIYIIGIDLSLEKTESNYCYKDKQYNHKFRSFKTNYKWIIKEFKKLKHEAELRGIKVYNIDPEPENFNVFPCYKDTYK